MANKSVDLPHLRAETRNGEGGERLYPNDIPVNGVHPIRASWSPDNPELASVKQPYHP